MVILLNEPALEPTLQRGNTRRNAAPPARGPIIPAEELQRLIAVAAEAIKAGEAGKPGAGADVLTLGYERSLRMADEGVPWGTGLATLYAEAFATYETAYLPVTS